MGLVLGWQNWIDDPAVGANATGTTFGDLGPSNVLTRSMGEVWRGQLTTASSIRLRFDLGAVRDNLRLFILAAPREGVLPGTGATARFVASTVAEDGQDTADVFATNPINSETGLWVILLSSPISARWIHWRILGVSGDTYWQIGRAFAGPCLVTSRGIGADWRRGAIETGDNLRGRIAGARYGLHGTRFRRLALSAPALTAAEAAEVNACGRAVGTTGQAFLAPFSDGQVAAVSTLGSPSAAALGVLGNFTRAPAARMRAATPDRWQADFEINEEL